MATNTKSTGGSKTPYEIRLELLQMAKEHMDAMFKAQTDYAAQMTQVLVKAGNATTEQFAKFAPVPYTMAEITEKANELYSFIQKRD